MDEEEVANLLKAVESEVHNRSKGDAVRLEVEKGCPQLVQAALRKTLRPGRGRPVCDRRPDEPAAVDAGCTRAIIRPSCATRPFVAPVSPALRERARISSPPSASATSCCIIPTKASTAWWTSSSRRRAIPEVLAIKQTLYRTGGDPRIIGALMNAVKNGKQVTAVVELRARFDEANNINGHAARGEPVCTSSTAWWVTRSTPRPAWWCGAMTMASAVTCISAPAITIPSTARLYTDLGLLTCRPDFGEDVTNLFNLLTGICQFQGSKKLLVAPFDLQQRILAIHRPGDQNMHGRDCPRGSSPR